MSKNNIYMPIILSAGMLYVYTALAMIADDTDTQELIEKKDTVASLLAREKEIKEFAKQSCCTRLVGRPFSYATLDTDEQELQELQEEDNTVENLTCLSIQNKKYFYIDENARTGSNTLHVKTDASFSGQVLLSFPPTIRHPFLPQITHVKLQNINLRLLSLRDFHGMCNLQQLDVSHNNITDILYAAGLTNGPYVTSTRHQSSRNSNREHCLAEFDISDNKLTKVNFDHLFALFPHMHTVNVAHNPTLKKMAITSVPAIYTGSSMGCSEKWETPEINITDTLNAEDQERLVHAYVDGMLESRSTQTAWWASTASLVPLCPMSIILAKSLGLYAGLIPSLTLLVGGISTAGFIGQRCGLIKTPFLIEQLETHAKRHILGYQGNAMEMV
jgi:hypothetical protein